jgi:hypothetical protein
MAEHARRHARRLVHQRYGRQVQLVVAGGRASLLRHGLEISGGVLLAGAQHPVPEVAALFAEARAWMTVLRWGADRCQGCGVRLCPLSPLAVCSSCETWERLAWEQEGQGELYRPARRGQRLRLVEDHHQAHDDAAQEERIPAQVSTLGTWTSFVATHFAELQPALALEDFDGRYLTVVWRRPAGGARRITVAILDGDTTEDVATTLRRHITAAEKEPRHGH